MFKMESGQEQDDTLQSGPQFLSQLSNSSMGSPQILIESMPGIPHMETKSTGGATDIKQNGPEFKSDLSNPSSGSPQDSSASVHFPESVRDIQISYTDLVYDETKPLGRGAYGQVFLGTFRREPVAIKIYDFRGILSEKDRKAILHEAKAMDKLRSKYLVGFRGIFLEPSYGLVMEYCDGATLTQRLAKSEIRIDYAQQLLWGKQISYGLHALHSINIFHRDLKSDNVLLNTFGEAKIADFGLSQIKSSASTQSRQGSQSAAGTIPWMAPELFEGNPHSAAADIYSLGTVLWEIVARRIPFSGKMAVVIKGKVRVFYNIASFNLTVADRALIFPEFKEAVILGYCYNSQSPTASAWRLPLKNFVPPDTADAKQIIFTEADGHETPYTFYSGSSSQKMYFAPGLMNGTPYLVYDDQNYQWFWYHPGTQVCERYNKYGKIEERRDAWGNVTAFNYIDPVRGTLQYISGPSGIEYWLDSNSKSDGGRLDRIRVKKPGQDYGSYIQSYDFDKNGLLITSGASLNGQDLTAVYQTQYGYSSINPPLLKSIQQDDGTQLTIDFVSFSQNSVLSYRVQTLYLPAADGQCRTDFTYSSGKVGVEVRSAWMADFFLDSQSRLIRKDQYVSYTDGPLSKETTQYEYATAGQEIHPLPLLQRGNESFNKAVLSKPHRTSQKSYF